jgi:hypothetical protein
MTPPPQRIVWLYKRWQPLYDEIGRTVVPPRIGCDGEILP